MKKNNYIMILLFALIFINACNDKRSYDIPEIKVPIYINAKGLNFITIDSLKRLYPAGSNYDTYNFIENTLKAIKGRVSGNDESGNIYKTVYIQDSTGSIVLGTQLTGLFSNFRVGQEVIVELDGLAVGKYAGSYQIGSAIPSYYGDTKQMDRMSATEFQMHVFRNEKPIPDSIKPVIYYNLPDMTENIRGTLVTFKNAYFKDGGKKIFAVKGSGYGNDSLYVNGKRVLVRTSEYANFAADTVPIGIGDITCLLTRYQRGKNDAVQLIIRNRDDLKFKK
ncbi:MAG: DUF5689 domain-containing protein [Paludibacteraceae bacterium]